MRTKPFVCQELNCQRSGAETALTTLYKHFKESLFESLPHLWDQMTEPLAQLPSASIREGTKFNESLPFNDCVEQGIGYLSNLASAIYCGFCLGTEVPRLSAGSILSGDDDTACTSAGKETCAQS